MRSRFTILVGLVLALALVAAACSSDDTGDESTTTTEATTTTTEAAETTTTAAPETTTTEAMEAIDLVIWADEKRALILETLAPKVLEETNVNLVIDVIVYDDLREQVTTAARPAKARTSSLAHTTGPARWLQAASGTDRSRRGDEEWFPVALQSFNYNGQLYALPYQSEAVALYYNTDLVPEPPTTIEELTAICDELSDIENCWAIPGGGDGADPYHNYAFVSAQGGYILPSTPRPVMTSRTSASTTRAQLPA